MNIFGFDYAVASGTLLGLAIISACFGLIFALFRFIIFTYFERND